jgi:hypothetical protein
MSEPVGRLKEAGEIALDTSDRLYNIVGDLLEKPGASDTHYRVARYVQEAAHAIRRQALWLIGEATQKPRTEARSE